MSKLFIAMLMSAGIGLAGSAAAADRAATMSRDAYNAKKDEIQATYKSEEKRCDGLKGNAHDVCEAEAKGHRDAAKADLEAEYKATPKAQRDARVAHADADYKVAKEKCDDLKGNEKDVCVKEAKAAHTKAKADAKVAQAANATNGDRATVATAKREANEDKREAEYKVAKEKCDALSGDAKDQCQQRAKARYGK